MAATILVCDDEDVLRALVRATLAGCDYSFAEAVNGEESLQLARELCPDLIVLDMMMPGRSGLEILAEIRQDPPLADTPVLMLTARTQVSDRQAAAELGADRFLAKPFSPRELLSTVEELLDESRWDAA
ncbi:MAG: response regulator [Actinobacteria bacterium]|nr:response regulator [Actinomycetota bacterium]